jgi:hypothetical protein
MHEFAVILRCIAAELNVKSSLCRGPFNTTFENLNSENLKITIYAKMIISLSKGKFLIEAKNKIKYYY